MLNLSRSGKLLLNCLVLSLMLLGTQEFIHGFIHDHSDIQEQIDCDLSNHTSGQAITVQAYQSQFEETASIALPKLVNLYRYSPLQNYSARAPPRNHLT